jgi:hypothetical protein
VIFLFWPLSSLRLPLLRLSLLLPPSFLLLLPLLLLLLPFPSWSYHSFMAMGYNSCMTCHYNPGGNGPLNDYGRALMATELSSRWWAPKKISDDTLAETSHFLGPQELPYWFRPHGKYRLLQIVTNPGSQTKVSREIPMQRELGSTFILNSEQTKLVTLSFSHHDQTTPYRTSYNGEKVQELRQKESSQSMWILKEAYGRFQLKEDQWILVGQQDKPFGIRDSDHTLSSRRESRLTQYDQSLGVLYFKTHELYEFSFMTFLGNINDPSQKKAGGLSSLFEFNLSDQTRLGASFLTEKNDSFEIFALSIHSRLNMNYGSSFSSELGILQKNHFDFFQSETSHSYYWILQHMIRLGRGFNFILEQELFKPHDPLGEKWLHKTRVGLLTFPLPRSEIRFHLVQEKSLEFNGGKTDVWQMQTQLHVAL